MVSGNIPGDSHANMVRIPCIIFFALTPIFVGLRLWNRIAKRSGMGLDDYSILVSFVSRKLLHFAQKQKSNVSGH